MYTILISVKYRNKNTIMQAISYHQLKKAFLDSGYEIRLLPARTLESFSLDAPLEVKRHSNSDILGLIMPDENMIAIANEYSPEERATTLIHELIHLVYPDMAELDVEAATLELEQNLSPAQYGFFQFLVS
jgi:hypothetical protein